MSKKMDEKLRKLNIKKTRAKKQDKIKLAILLKD